MRLRVEIRRAAPEDGEAVGRLCASLWPDATAEEHGREIAPYLADSPPGGLAAIFFVAEAGEGVVGFLQAGLRSHADGCDPARAVGFIEGWFVAPEWRGKGVGAALLREAEAWAREQGCREMASDTWLDNVESQRVHEALGFEEVDRCVHYRKAL